jgi:hypothetical protein
MFDDAGAPRANFVARPYPRRVAGTPTRFSVQLGTSDPLVELDWTNDPGAGSTEIYIPAQALFGTASLAVTSEGAQLNCAAGSNQVRCGSPASGSMIVRIRPGS